MIILLIVSIYYNNSISALKCLKCNLQTFFMANIYEKMATVWPRSLQVIGTRFSELQFEMLSVYNNYFCGLTYFHL